MLNHNYKNKYYKNNFENQNSTSDIFYQKYCKYKMKYFNLKKSNMSHIKDEYERFDNNKMKYLNLKKSNLNQVAGGGIRHLKNMTGSSINSTNRNILISEEMGSS